MFELPEKILLLREDPKEKGYSSFGSSVPEPRKVQCRQFVLQIVSYQFYEISPWMCDARVLPVRQVSQEPIRFKLLASSVLYESVVPYLRIEAA